ncbi:unnamed protein product [Adineta steineri]|uniref:Uncharacterized protein n=1 Tax=Adineta steineri TaxID=433720 RepID=A0A814ZEZ3_9BILA|nr:unnamed protein product [Adineta steineri]CAF1115734.1 unnamed protein product [Adineta steineri]CAF1242924.1 unnamed protein product [Adineta steineri]CAF1496834.1 unnamed protein product [Adineta steineri]CAF1529157.1 unnamed protein product [Adineta steineri]
MDFDQQKNKINANLFCYYFIEQLPLPFVIDSNTTWKQDASTVAGGHGLGNGTNQLNHPYSVYVDDDNKNIYISDQNNHRIVRWGFNKINGEVVAGGNGEGNRINQLKKPSDAILDKKSNSLLICDFGNRRVVKWSRQDDTTSQLIIIPFIGCWGLAMDNNGDLYVSDLLNDEVSRWKEGEAKGMKVAGKSRNVDPTNQIYIFAYIFVDEYYSVYVADRKFGEAMEWKKDAKNGTIVAHGHMSEMLPDIPPRLAGIIVDRMGNIYVSDVLTCQITRWLPGTRFDGTVAGGMGCGNGTRQIKFPADLSFDRQGNLYVVDQLNNRVQKYAVELD